jgi:hypothetical protein
MMRDGETDRNGNRWVRCEACGDSKKNPWKAHKMVDPNGGAYCFLCADSTKLGMADMIDVALGYAHVEEVLERGEGRERTPRLNGRFTRLERFDIEGDPAWDSFEQRDQFGRVIGWHNRHKSRKVCENEGRRGLGYVEDSLLSSPSGPLVVVEGPYDVITDRHVCVFGTISRPVLKRFRLQYVWLFPDPDQICTQPKRQRFHENVVGPALDDLVFVLGVIHGNADPDEATVLVHVPERELNIWSRQ